MSEAGPFSEEQKQYLQGFLTALNQKGPSPLAGFAGVNASGQFTASPDQATERLSDPTPDSGGLFGTPLKKLCKEERLKLEKNPLDMFGQMQAMAAAGEMAEGGDVFRFKFHGLFNTSPVQEGYMLRTRIPGCVVDASQMQRLADLGEFCAGGYSHVTTRGNLQFREIPAAKTIEAITTLYKIGLTSRGAGGDNIRNITASPISGVDPDELIDCSGLASSMHFTILNNRDFYGLPRKFNIAFDGGGAISIMGDTNDIGFLAVRVNAEQATADRPEGTYFKLLVGGVAGHGHFAKDTGWLLRPEQCVATACGILRIFVKNGNRTNRKRARLAFCVEKMGMEPFLAAVREEIDFDPMAVATTDHEPRRSPDRWAHIGVHPQTEKGVNYVGVGLLVGKMSIEQMRGLADLAAEFGDGHLRFTIWQNLILSGVPDASVPKLEAGLKKLGLSVSKHECISGLAACTGNQGCKYALTDTKGHAADINDHFSQHVKDGPALSIVLTGCPNSCAQHFCADIGLLGIKTKVDGESVEAYNITLGGGTDNDQGLGREVAKAIPHDKVPALLEDISRVYQDRSEDGERFVDFVRRHEPSEWSGWLATKTDKDSDKPELAETSS